MALQFPWPAIPGSSEQPFWTNQGFRIGNTILPILSYSVMSSGWTDELTKFHEETAGDDHPIDRASRWQAVEQLEKHIRDEFPIILEIGCSSGFMLRIVRERLPHAFVIGSDYVRGPLEQLATDIPAVPLLQFDLVTCPLPRECVDAVILLNVLEHIEDDVTAIRQVYRILKPGGVVVIEVPAGPHLYDVYDKLLLHRRRYALTELQNLMRSAGFQIVWKSHLGFFIYPGFWLVKQCNKRFLSEEGVVQRQIVAQSIRATDRSRLFDVLLRLELALGQWITYPCGIRCLLTCRKGL